jgi:prolyl oligopeptidase
MHRHHLLALSLLTLPTSPTTADPPTTKKEPVKDVYHGVLVTDDYRWLEDGTRKEVQAWSDAQNAHARGVLDRLPGRDTLRQQVTKILAAKMTRHFDLIQRGGRLFALKRQPPKEQPFLVVLPGLDQPGRARVVLEPGRLDPKGGTSIDWYVPSPDGRLVAVSLSREGSEAGDVHVFETETGNRVHEVVPRVNGGTAGGDLAWAPDGKGFYYTRYPRGRERAAEDMGFYQQLYYHPLGTPTEKDRYELGKELPRVAEIRVQVDGPSGRALVTVQDGDSGRFAHYLRSPDGKYRQLSRFDDRLVQATFGPGGDLYLLSRQGAPRGKILRLPASETDLGKARVIVPQGKDTIIADFYQSYARQTVLPTESRLYVLYQLGGPSALRAFGLDGNRLAGPKQLPVSAVSGLAPLTGDDVVFENGSFVEAPAVYVYRARAGTTEKTPLISPPEVSFRDVRVIREFATSKDGTKVPVTVLVPKGAKLDGTDPCLATAYGGFGLSVEPRVNPAHRILFDHGFVVAVANLRGGGEFGEEWHRAGVQTKRQNIYDDFAAVLRHLAARRYTSPGRLAIEGGSNGGLLMGVALTQQPALVKAVVAHVGIFDMLRVERTPNGAFNVPEYGTVTDAEQFKALHAYSPYHNVRDGAKYPAALFLTGANDPRVDPMHSRKMVARLQAAGAAPGLALLRTSAGTGHGLGTPLSAQIEEQVDVLSFLFAQLGVPPLGETRNKACASRPLRDCKVGNRLVLWARSPVDILPTAGRLSLGPLLLVTVGIGSLVRGHLSQPARQPGLGLG